MKDKNLRAYLVVGDSMTDLEMLKKSEGIALIIDRNKIPDTEIPNEERTSPIIWKKQPVNQFPASKSIFN